MKDVGGPSLHGENASNGSGRRSQCPHTARESPCMAESSAAPQLRTTWPLHAHLAQRLPRGLFYTRRVRRPLSQCPHGSSSAHFTKVWLVTTCDRQHPSLHCSLLALQGGVPCAYQGFPLAPCPPTTTGRRPPTLRISQQMTAGGAVPSRCAGPNARGVHAGGAASYVPYPPAAGPPLGGGGLRRRGVWLWEPSSMLRQTWKTWDAWQHGVAADHALLCP